MQNNGTLSSSLEIQLIFKNFGDVGSGPHHVTWRGTTIKPRDITLKMKLNRAIPQSFATMGGKVQVTVRYRDQPKICFQCGSHDQERKDCTQQRTYAQAVEEDIPPKVDPPATQANDSTPTESGDEEYIQKRRKKKEKKKVKKYEFTAIPETKRKTVLSREESLISARHSMPA